MKLKKLLLPIIGISLSLSLYGCSKNTRDASEFDAYIDSLPQRLIESDNLNIEYLFVNPQDYGFEDTLLNLPYTDEEDYQESKNESEKIIDELEEFDYETLHDDQKLTYDILKDNLERSLLTLAYYDLDNSYLGSFVSFQAQLPFLLQEYNFEREQDLNSYFHILETSEESFHKYVEIEKQRQEKGTGMSKAILDKTIAQCENFSNSERVFLIDVINKKIDEAEFLNMDQKEEAKKKNENLLINNLQAAYRNTKEELSQLTPDAQDLGLYSKPEGKAYYEALLQQRTGLDMNIKEVKEYLEKKEDELTKEAQELFMKNPGLLAKLDFENMKYSDFTSVEETLHYLQTQIFQDFPELNQLNFRISTVDESMKDNFSPAAYLQSRIDSPISAEESIIINGDYTDNLFLTIAHEGYPGHMYQNVYFKSLQLPTVRYLLDYNGYSEGWATYVEGMASKYATAEDKEILELYDLNTKMVQVQMCLFDIGIHYDGWDRTEFKKQLSSQFGDSLEDEDINEQYDIFLETPTNYLQYYLTGFQFEDMQKKAKETLGAAYDPVEFHEVILKTGPAPFTILNQQLDQYLETK